MICAVGNMLITLSSTITQYMCSYSTVQNCTASAMGLMRKILLGAQHSKNPLVTRKKDKPNKNHTC